MKFKSFDPPMYNATYNMNGRRDQIGSFGHYYSELCSNCHYAAGQHQPSSYCKKPRPDSDFSKVQITYVRGEFVTELPKDEKSITIELKKHMAWRNK
jgi:hypothetical protein